MMPLRQDCVVSQTVDPPHSVLLLVGREDFEPPSSFGDRTCAATADCVAVGVRSVQDGPTTVRLSADATTGLIKLGDFEIESEGLMSLRDIYNREYAAVGVEPGHRSVTVWGNHESEPSDVVFELR